MAFLIRTLYCDLGKERGRVRGGSERGRERGREGGREGEGGSLTVSRIEEVSHTVYSESIND